MDKQDGLARVIGDACWKKWGDGPWGTATEQADCQAAAVRSFMGSDEVVERVAAIIFLSETVGGGWGELIDNQRDAYRDSARAALSAAIGEDIGGGRER